MSLTSWPDHSPFGNQKRFWRDPGEAKRLRFFEIAFVPVYLDQFASRIVNVDHSIMRAATVFRVGDCIGEF